MAEPNSYGCVQLESGPAAASGSSWTQPFMNYSLWEWNQWNENVFYPLGWCFPRPVMCFPRPVILAERAINSYRKEYHNSNCKTLFFVCYKNFNHNALRYTHISGSLARVTRAGTTRVDTRVSLTPRINIWKNISSFNPLYRQTELF